MRILFLHSSISLLASAFGFLVIVIFMSFFSLTLTLFKLVFHFFVRIPERVEATAMGRRLHDSSMQFEALALVSASCPAAWT
ncbi:Protein kinase superfamily protein [Perilla frutescens var. frutescens]|nr:Protein kinase superfamily protein [Perilla frutescens var. frutescens]